MKDLTKADLEDLENRIKDIDTFEESPAIMAIKELVSSTPDGDSKTNPERENIDFKTDLTIDEISAFSIIEHTAWVLNNNNDFNKKILIPDLTNRMKRHKVSKEGKGRSGIINIFKSIFQQPQFSGENLPSFFKPRNPQNIQ